GHFIPGAYRFDALITTFEMILSDCPELREIQWRCVIIDEAHRLKNRNCKLLEGLKLMDLEHKVLLTGTPLQNTVEELFSLLNFLEPTQFPLESAFLQEFGDLKTEEQVCKAEGCCNWHSAQGPKEPLLTVTPGSPSLCLPVCPCSSSACFCLPCEHPGPPQFLTQSVPLPLT
ncbi:chromodomain-helicase-DNA-binding protein 8-like, partial [Chiloscyllium plagiosum]|uniref:chromodomain-helicase-DNA-binding protein 8-like n=1 Tax=Chiloscyllium plagiosum TaxID=36176 RepID=UPI001CB80F53